MKQDKQEKTKNYLEQITKKGWLKQNEALNAKGFSDPKQNLKVLTKCEGNLEQSLSKLQEKNKPKGKHLLDDEYVKQVGLMIAQGFSDPKLNLKALHKTDGDIEKAKLLIKEKQSDPQYVEKQKKLNEYQEVAQKLMKEGFPSEELNTKALKKNNGDIEKAKLYLKKNQEKGKDELSDASTYFLDGHNLIFCLEDIRSLYLKNQKEQAQQTLVQRVKSAFKGKQVKQINIIFDQAQTEEDVQIDGIQFKIISSSKLKFNNPQECLVQLCSSAPEKSILISSDKNLKEKLKKFKVMKSVDFSKYLVQH